MDDVVNFITSPAALLATEITDRAERMLAREVDSLTVSSSGILEKVRPVRWEELCGPSAVVVVLWPSGLGSEARGVRGVPGCLRAHSTNETWFRQQTF